MAAITTTSETGSKLVRAVCTGTALPLQVPIDVKRIPLIFCEISVGEIHLFTIRNYVVIFKCQHHSYGKHDFCLGLGCLFLGLMFLLSNNVLEFVFVKVTGDVLKFVFRRWLMSEIFYDSR